jgi:hypothetical protein
MIFPWIFLGLRRASEKSFESKPILFNTRETLNRFFICETEALPCSTFLLLEKGPAAEAKDAPQS